ncbi:hypothetical protein NC652_028655 [Populus alba x Populus x berolinensis]|nr:hypothetical protein NC652_028655 [Populus alba x Populus x berolinensis]
MHDENALQIYINDQKLTSQVHEIVGRINGRFGTLNCCSNTPPGILLVGLTNYYLKGVNLSVAWKPLRKRFEKTKGFYVGENSFCVQRSQQNNTVMGEKEKEEKQITRCQIALSTSQPCVLYMQLLINLNNISATENNGAANISGSYYQLSNMFLILLTISTVNLAMCNEVSNRTNSPSFRSTAD